MLHHLFAVAIEEFWGKESSIQAALHSEKKIAGRCKTGCRQWDTVPAKGTIGAENTCSLLAWRIDHERKA